jgi:arylsulfatase A-like enzyme
MVSQRLSGEATCRLMLLSVIGSVIGSVVYRAACGFLSVVLLCGALVTVARGQAAPPNVLLIISDDQAWNDYSFMGHAQIHTPHIDRLASQSLMFTRGYVPDSLCRPSLASIITGRYPHEHGIVGNDPPAPDRDRRSPASIAARETYLQHIDRAATIPRILQPKDYLALQTGKWWEGNYARGGFHQGMTHGDPRRGGRHGDDGLNIGRQGLEPIYSFVRAAKAQQKPFFVWYAPMMPHTPHNPPQRLLDKYLPKTDSEFVARYYAMCEWFDETCGALLDFLDQEQLSDNTLVIYVTDNGWINEPDASRYAPKSKRSQYDGGVRTPILVRWPGQIAPRRDDETLVTSLDIAPTILAAAGSEIPADLPGIDLRKQQQLAQRKTIFGEILEHDIVHMTNPAASLQYRWVIDGWWKLIVPHPARIPDGELELYDLRADPWETQNVVAQHPEIVQRLRSELDRWWSPNDAH